MDNLILAYHPKCGLKTENGGTSPLINNGAGDGVFNWGGEDENAVSDIKNLWKSLEKYALHRKVLFKFIFIKHIRKFHFFLLFNFIRSNNWELQILIQILLNNYILFVKFILQLLKLI